MSFKILSFGTFDGIHDGHREMLAQVRQPTTYNLQPTTSPPYLIVAVAPDNVVAEIKGALPKHTGAQRITALKAEHLADEVVLGDSENDSWKIIKKYKPNIIALGYDQQALKDDLERFIRQEKLSIPLVVIPSFEPTRYKSSLL